MQGSFGGDDRREYRTQPTNSSTRSSTTTITQVRTREAYAGGTLVTGSVPNHGSRSRPRAPLRKICWIFQAGTGRFVSDEGSALLPKSAPGVSIFRPPRPKPKAPADGRGGDARDPKRDGTTVEDSEHEQSAA